MNTVKNSITLAFLLSAISIHATGDNNSQSNLQTPTYDVSDSISIRAKAPNMRGLKYTFINGVLTINFEQTTSAEIIIENLDNNDLFSYNVNAQAFSAYLGQNEESVFSIIIKIDSGNYRYSFTIQ